MNIFDFYMQDNIPASYLVDEEFMVNPDFMDAKRDFDKRMKIIEGHEKISLKEKSKLLKLYIVANSRVFTDKGGQCMGISYIGEK